MPSNTPAITAGDYEIESGAIISGRAFRATVTERRIERAGLVSEVGYVFVEPFQMRDTAMKAAEKYVVLASLHADRHLPCADAEFAVQ